MRVVQLVCSDGFGGVEQYIRTLAVGLAGRGVDVDVIGGSRAAMPAAVIGAGASWSPGDDPRQAWRALRALARPDVVVSHMTQADAVASLYARTWGRGSRHVSVRHFGAPRGGSAPSRIVSRILSRSIDAQLAISDYVSGMIEGDSTVVHTGVTVRSASEARDRIVLVAQRLEPEKETETAVRAWAASTARAEGWRLQIAGQGSMRADLEALARTLGVADSVEFLGFRDDVDRLLGRAAVVVAPTPKEGLGILVLEAMAAGTPVIAAAGGGHRETVGATCPELLFPPGDAAAAGRLIDTLTRDEDRRRALGRELRSAQQDRFTVERQISATIALYERVIG